MNAEWIAKHSLKIFGVVAVCLIAAGTLAGFLLYEGERSAQRLDVLEPKVTKIITLCEPGPAISREKAQDCSEHFRVGLTICRHFQPCRAAFLALATYPPPARVGRKGVVVLSPHHAGQQPGPGGQPGSRGSTSGAGVEVCALEQACAGAGAGLGG